MKNVSEYLVRGDDGKVNVQGTMDKFHGELVKYLATRETEDKDIAVAVNAVFDQFKGANCNLPALASLAIAKMSNVDPNNWGTLQERIADYVRENPGLYQIKKGKGGGVTRISDHPATTETAAQ